MSRPPVKKTIARLAAINAAGRDSGLSPAQREVLADLGLHPGSTYQQVAGRIDGNAQTLRRHMADLRKSGYVVRGVKDGDVRITEFSLTAKGVEVLEKIAGAA